MKNNNSRALREGAMMIAATVVLILLTLYVPFFSVVGMFLCGVPMACMAAKNDVKSTVVALVGAFLLIFVVTGNLFSAISLVLMSILPGVVAGWCLGKGVNFFTTLFASCLAACLGWVFEIFVIDALVLGKGVNGLMDEMLSMFSQAFDMTLSTLPAEISGGDEMKKMFDQIFETLTYLLKLYFPSILVLSSMLTGYVIVMCCGFFIRRLKIKNVTTVPFSMLKAPRSMSFAAIVLYFISMFGDEQSRMWAVCANVVFILYTIIGICGFSLLDNKLSKKITKGGARAALYVAFFLFGGALFAFAANILVIIGIIDSTHNFRKITGDGKVIDGGDGGGWV